MCKTARLLLFCSTIAVLAGASGAAAAGKAGANSDLAPAVKCGENGDQAFARLIDYQPRVHAAALRADGPLESHWPAPDPRDTGLEAYSRCRVGDGIRAALADGRT